MSGKGSPYAQWSDAPHGDDPLEIDIRPAKPADQDRINVIQAACARAPIDLPRLLADADRAVLVAMHRGEVVGWAATQHYRVADGPAGAGHYLAGVTVHPSARRHGVGDALTAARLEWIWARADEAWYFANARNRVSISLHDRYGFVQVAESAGVHGGTFDGGRGLVFRASRPAGPVVG